MRSKKNETKKLKNNPYSIHELALLKVDSILGRRLYALDEKKIIKTAIKKSGVNGYIDELFQEALSKLCECSRIGPPRILGERILYKNYVTQCVHNWFSIQSEITKHPEILEEEIQRPIFIIGLTRSGSTFLHRLLAQDPANRTPKLWEMLEPVRSPKETAKEHNKRIKKIQRALKKYYRYHQSLKTIHFSNVDLPEECMWLMSNNLLSDRLSMISPIYARRFNNLNDIPDLYKFHKLHLQLLQWYLKKERWVLKSPFHITRLKSLLNTYPDACIIQTHRNPLEVIPSNMSLLRDLQSGFISLDKTNRGNLQYNTDLPNIENYLFRLRNVKSYFSSLVTNRIDAENNPNNKAIFYDLHYNNFIADPIASIKKIYEAFQLRMTETAERNMESYLKDNKKDKYGKHKYSLEEFALDQKIINKICGSYIQHFNVV